MVQTENGGHRLEAAGYAMSEIPPRSTRRTQKPKPVRLTTVLTECSPGEGGLDFVRVLRIIDRYLPADAPVLLEHMTTFEEYRRAYDYVAQKASEAGVGI